ncbi:SRPBCC domain-containing protein [soil metagenome]
MTAPLYLEIERTYEAPIDVVFDAWTSPEVMRRWWQAETGWSTSDAVADLRIGGDIRVVMHDPAKGVDHGGGGVYTEIERPNRLAFTWLWDDDHRGTLIEINFAEVAASTKVTFKHSGLWDEEAVRDHTHGWSNILDSLGRSLEAGAGRS